MPESSAPWKRVAARSPGCSRRRPGSNSSISSCGHPGTPASPSLAAESKCEYCASAAPVGRSTAIASAGPLAAPSRRLSRRAPRSRTYPSSRAAASTASRVAAEIRSAPSRRFKTSDTVAGDVAARAAMSLYVG